MKRLLFLVIFVFIWIFGFSQHNPNPARLSTDNYTDVLSNNVLDTFLYFTLGADSSCGATINYMIGCMDNSKVSQLETGRLNIAAVRNGTLYYGMDSSNTQAKNGGSLLTDFTIVGDIYKAKKVYVTVKAKTNLTVSSLWIWYQVKSKYKITPY